jgi:PAS domain-containing protein
MVWFGPLFILPLILPAISWSGSRPWFWFFAAYQYIVILYGVIILWRFAYRRRGIYRRQLVGIVIGTCLPIIGNCIYLMGLSPVKGLDLTPFVFVVSGLIYAVSVFPLRFMDVIPVARGALVERIPAGIFVLDADGNVVDMNPASEKHCRAGDCQVSPGKTIEKVWPPWLEVVKSEIAGGSHTEIVTEKDGCRQYLESL